MSKLELIDFELTKREKQVLKHQSPKQVETYIMQKFVHQFSFMKSCFHEKFTLDECLIELNALLISEGYKPKKAISTFSRLLNKPFVSYDIDQDHYGAV
ncbi:hypothetical protein [Ureibacillus aquaedulcis]|uniref:Uncharacterized protein n=1 Tax=Ureibacillus aquaedulcis TaxID=3058421 RepID=A0ABT8GN90_9BACL|nr:hypothetical protein [Ureibacillus sp. BA0131]MDN4492882.1 hypothetical protein [Ureibacillus sp. BA0131]